MSDQGKLSQAINSVNEEEVKRLVSEKIEAGIPAADILDECHKGMAELGQRFESGDCFIPELIMAGQIMENVMKELGPLLEKSTEKKETTGNVVIGTVQHDIHNIGKDIVVTMLRGAGFNVIDLGVDASPDKFVEAVKENDAILIGMSVLITTCYKSIPATVEALKQAGLRDKVSVLLGGAAASEMLAERTGCDYYGKTAVDAVNLATKVAQMRGNMPAA